MQKSLVVAFVLAFLLMSINIFDATINKFYPEKNSNYLSSYLESQEPAQFPVRNLVVSFIYLAIGFAFVVLSFQTVHLPLMINLFGWTGLCFIVWGNYKLYYSSAYSIIYGVSSPPAWTLIIQWVSLIALVFLGYKLQDIDK